METRAFPEVWWTFENLILKLNNIFPNQNFQKSYYAPPSRPEGPRRCPDRGNADGALVFLMLLQLLYALGVYTKQENWCQQIRIQSQYCRPGAFDGYYFWYSFLVFIYGIHIRKIRLVRIRKQYWLGSVILCCIHSSKIHLGKL